MDISNSNSVPQQQLLDRDLMTMDEWLDTCGYETGTAEWFEVGMDETRRRRK